MLLHPFFSIALIPWTLRALPTQSLGICTTLRPTTRILAATRRKLLLARLPRLHWPHCPPPTHLVAVPGSTLTTTCRIFWPFGSRSSRSTTGRCQHRHIVCAQCIHSLYESFSLQLRPDIAVCNSGDLQFHTFLLHQQRPKVPWGMFRTRVLPGSPIPTDSPPSLAACTTRRPTPRRFVVRPTYARCDHVNRTSFKVMAKTECTPGYLYARLCRLSGVRRS